MKLGNQAVTGDKIDNDTVALENMTTSSKYLNYKHVFVITLGNNKKYLVSFIDKNIDAYADELDGIVPYLIINNVFRADEFIFLDNLSLGNNLEVTIHNITDDTPDSANLTISGNILYWGSEPIFNFNTRVASFTINNFDVFETSHNPTIPI